MAIVREQAGDTQRRTREDIIEALRRYESLHGPSISASFNPATARWCDRQDLRDIYYGPTGPWPSLNSIRDLFGSFNAAREPAGLPVNRPGPARRRKTGEHGPVRGVRVERVYVQSDASRETTEKLRGAQRRASAAESKLADALERAERAERKFEVVRDRNIRLRLDGARGEATRRSAVGEAKAATRERDAAKADANLLADLDAPHANVL
jgi:hypothetical protein